ncbi:hypothetical protein GP486_002134 [Trichoglossum hirsutum]|uniref:Uncharacterized protein n=1 Tax=Trichoglossum hirsutum TaxID=265104 RepID=A0A9P8LFN7_9PEZI|nr:hypothetical protein GP486_002134 [Trichoglossum hirsutum]
MGRNKKRKNHAVQTGPNGDDSHGRCKRRRPSPTDEGDDFAGASTTQPRVDPLTGQHSAFPGLDDDDPDELFYGPANDGLDYLRMVRSEARQVPQLLAAPKEDDDEIYNCGVRDSRGFYEDGAYTAVPILGPVPSYDKEHRSPKEICLDRLILRFKLHRANLRCTPPASTIRALSKDHPTSCEATKASYSWWHRLLRATDPLPAQLSAMNQVTVLRLIRLITKNGFMKRDKVLDPRVSGWIWALLGRVEDVGVMGSEDVGIVRELGKRAIWVVEGLKQREKRGILSDAENIQEHDLDEEIEECVDVGDAGGEGEALDGDKSDPIPGEDNALHKNVVDQENSQFATAPQYEELEEGEVSSSLESCANGASAEGAADELAAAKARLMARVSTAEHGSSPSTSRTTGDHNVKEAVLPEEQEYQEQLSSTRGTLNMIITIVGEVFGQRDLLEHRDLLWELPE